MPLRLNLFFAAKTSLDEDKPKRETIIFRLQYEPIIDASVTAKIGGVSKITKSKYYLNS